MYPSSSRSTPKQLCQAVFFVVAAFGISTSAPHYIAKTVQLRHALPVHTFSVPPTPTCLNPTSTTPTILSQEATVAIVVPKMVDHDPFSCPKR